MGGDNLEIQAFSEIYGRSVEIYAYDDKPMKTFSNESESTAKKQRQKKKKGPIRLSYHCNSHYNSIVRIDGASESECLDPSRVGEVEDDRIRLSALRSSEAALSTIALSDIEATDLECYHKALTESRRMFDEAQNGLGKGAMGNARSDSVIEKSLEEMRRDEAERVESAKELSRRQQKDEEEAILARIMKESEMEVGIGTGNGAIKAVVERGYSLEQATIAYSVFEAQQGQVTQEMLVQRMIDYIAMQEKSQTF